MNTTTYLSKHDVARRYSIGIRTVWRWTAQGILPEPYRLTSQCVRWRLDELEARDAQMEKDRGAA